MPGNFSEESLECDVSPGVIGYEKNSGYEDLITLDAGYAIYQDPFHRHPRGHYLGDVQYFRPFLSQNDPNPF